MELCSGRWENGTLKRQPSTAWIILCLLPSFGVNAHGLAPQQGASSAQETSKLDSELLERIRERCLEFLGELHEERDLPGLCAAIILPNGSEVPLAAGSADLDRELEIEPTARLLPGNIGKTYVSAAAHKLMLDGKLEFDRLAISYLADVDWFKRIPNANAIAVRQLLRHQSGIARHAFKPAFLPDGYAEPDKAWKPKELLSYIFDDQPLFPVGGGWAYVDMNNLVLGMIIEKQSGLTFYDYVNSNFLEPLLHVDTVASDKRLVPGLVQGHIKALGFEGGPDRTLQEGVFFFNP